MKFEYFFKKGCAACDAVKASTLSKFVEGEDYTAHEIITQADWDQFELMAVPAFKFADKVHLGMIGPRQLKKKLKEAYGE